MYQDSQQQNRGKRNLQHITQLMSHLNIPAYLRTDPEYELPHLDPHFAHIFAPCRAGGRAHG